MCLSYSKGYESNKRKQIFADVNTAESFNDYARREMGCEYNIYDILQLLKDCNQKNRYMYVKRSINRLTPAYVFGTMS